jgi:hypothetical protein
MRSDPGVPLSHYLDDYPGVGVEIICEPCAHRETLAMAGVVRRLTETGRDARSFGICAVADLGAKACPTCGARKWSSRPDWSGGAWSKPETAVRNAKSPATLSDDGAEPQA